MRIRHTGVLTLIAFCGTLYAEVPHASADEGAPPPDQQQQQQQQQMQPPPDGQQQNAAMAPPPGDDAQLAAAKQHFAAGKNAYMAMDYVNAVREFKAAEQIKPSAVLDYNIGLAYEGLHRPRAALKHYQRYIAAAPTAQNRAEVDQRIATLSAQKPEAQAPEEMAPPPGNAPPQGQYGGSGYYAAPGTDPYNGYPPPASQPYAVRPVRVKKRSSNWWIVFPIVGGAAIITVGLLVVVAYSSSSLYDAAPGSPAGAAGGTASAGIRF